MTIKAAHHVQVSIPVGAEDAARKFYCSVLGLTEVQKPDSLAERGGFWLQLEGFQIHFGAEDGIDRAKTRGHVAYLVEDLDSWKGKLVAAGYPITEGIPIPTFDRFEFRDPFGNRVEFLENHE